MKRMSGIVVSVLIVATQAAAGYEGELDTAFGDRGKATTLIAEGADGRAVAIQSDGKIVVAGSVWIAAGDLDFGLARYHPDGSLDPTFGNGGVVVTAFGPRQDRANAIAIASDGRILVAGSARLGSSTDTDFALAAYRTDGTLDESFADHGKATTSFGDVADEARAIVLDAQDRVVLAGSKGVPHPEGGRVSDVALARYARDGSLDTSFGVAGKVVTAVTDGIDEARAIALRSDGTMVVAGAAPGRGTPDFHVAIGRYHADGSVDDTFGADGWVRTRSERSPDSAAHAVAISPSGLILVAGHVDRDGNDVLVARFTPAGSFDATFGRNGSTVVDMGASDVADALTIRRDGRILVAGSSGDERLNSRFALLRLRSDGSLDRSFDGDGTLVTTFARKSSFGHAMALDANGRAVVAGATGYNCHRVAQRCSFAVARYRAVQPASPSPSTSPSRSLTPSASVTFSPSPSASPSAMGETQASSSRTLWPVPVVALAALAMALGLRAGRRRRPR